MARTVAPHKKEWFCPLCPDKSWATKQGLAYHLKTKHPDIEPEKSEELLKNTSEVGDVHGTALRKELMLKSLYDNMGLIYKSCKAANIGQRTYQVWYKNDPEFRAKVDDMKNYNLDHVESKLYNLIDGGDTAATIFYLKTKGRERGYAEKLEVDNTHRIEQIMITPHPDITITPIEDEEED